MAKDKTPAAPESPPAPVLVTLERLDAEGRVQDRWTLEAERTPAGFRVPGGYPPGPAWAVTVGRKRLRVAKSEVETDAAGRPVALVVTTAE